MEGVSSGYAKRRVVYIVMTKPTMSPGRRTRVLKCNRFGYESSHTSPVPFFRSLLLPSFFCTPISRLFQRSVGRCLLAIAICLVGYDCIDIPGTDSCWYTSVVLPSPASPSNASMSYLLNYLILLIVGLVYLISMGWPDSSSYRKTSRDRDPYHTCSNKTESPETPREPPIWRYVPKNTTYSLTTLVLPTLSHIEE